jgi:ribonuclease HI
MEVYTDASVDTGVFGIGYVINHPNGQTVTGKNYVKGEYTSMQAEWYGVMEGIHMSTHVDPRKRWIHVITDCKPLVKKIREPDDMYNDMWYTYRKKTLRALLQFETWDLYWEERKHTEHNEQANRLAREALWEGRGDDAIYGGAATKGVSFE